ncbi:glycosyltransferase [Patescibacteria group bacterium]|nr:glycosyltransferase [Patescibacteria group bacterium]
MRIAYFSDVFLPKIDGVVTSLLALTSELGRKGHSIAIFCPGPGRGKRIVWSARNVAIFPVLSVATRYPGLRVGAPGPRSLLKLRRFRADLIHIKSPGPLGIEGLIGGGMIQLPIVGSFNTYFMEPEYLRLIRLEKYKRVSSALWKFVVRFYNRCDLVESPSIQAISDLREHGIQRPMRVVRTGIDLSFVHKVRSSAVSSVKAKYGLGDLVVIYVGRLSREKSLDFLVKAFAKVVTAVAEAQLLIVGDGPIRAELEEQVHDLDLSGRVIFTGFVRHDVLLSSGILQASNLFCTASTSEVQPVSVIEAMAVSLPIVGVAARGMKELVDGNGILVDVGDVDGFAEAVIGFLHSREQRMRASEWSKLRSKQYSIETVADTMEDMYSLLISQANHASRR